VTLPDWIEPMAATLTQDRFGGPEWIFQRKFDGIRLLAFKDAAGIRLLSRNRLPQKLPPIAEALALLPVSDFILDGEVTWEGLAYHVFDVPWLDGRDLTALPLEERLALLRALPLTPPLHQVATLHEARPWEHACRERWEGVIAKRVGSRYEQRRSPHWLKMKCELTADFRVGGFTDPVGTRVGLGALLMGKRDGDDLVYAGKVGTGFDRKLLLELRARLDQLLIPEPPFTRGTGLPRAHAHWTRPEIAVRVAFIEWTSGGKLRHPRLLAVE
jgi:bifunctional non-homologous end joining protein LigD